MVSADTFVDFLKYVVPFFKVDTFQEWGGETSSIEFSIIYYIPCSLESEHFGLTLILWEQVVSKVLDYWGHPIVGRSYTVDSLGLIYRMYTWFTKKFDRDDLQEFDIFCGGQLGQDIYLGIL